MKCPYSNTGCIYVDTLTMTMEKPCHECEYYNQGTTAPFELNLPKEITLEDVQKMQERLKNSPYTIMPESQEVKFFDDRVRPTGATPLLSAFLGFLNRIINKKRQTLAGNSC